MSNAAVINATSTSGQTVGAPISIKTGGDVVLKAYGTGSGNWFVVMAFAPVVNGVTCAPVTLTIDYNQPGRQTSAVGTSATEWVGWVLDQGGTWEASGIVEGYQPGEALSDDLGTFASFNALPQYSVKIGARASVLDVQYTYGAGGWEAVGSSQSRVSKYLAREYDPSEFFLPYAAGDCTVTRDSTAPNTTGSRRSFDVADPKILFVGAKANHTVSGFTTSWSYSDHNREADNDVVLKNAPWSSEIATDSTVVVLNLCVGSDNVAGQFSIFINEKLLGDYTVASTTLPDRVILTFSARSRRKITIVASQSVGFWREFLWTTDNASNTFPVQSIKKGFFGDSYTVGQGITDKTKIYQHIASQLAGTPAFVSSGLSGTGFAATSVRGVFSSIAPRFLATLISPLDVLYVIGGINDHASTTQAVSDGAVAFYSYMRENHPSTSVITLITSRSSLYTLHPDSVSAIIAAANASGYFAIDIGAVLMSPGLFSDGLHPNEIGARVLGTWIGDTVFANQESIP